MEYEIVWVIDMKRLMGLVNIVKLLKMQRTIEFFVYECKMKHEIVWTIDMEKLMGLVNIKNLFFYMIYFIYMSNGILRDIYTWYCLGVTKCFTYRP